MSVLLVVAIGSFIRVLLGISTPGDKGRGDYPGSGRVYGSGAASVAR